MNRIRILLLLALLLPFGSMRSDGLEPAMQTMQYGNPTLTQPSLNEDTVALLYLDNDVVDEVGVYTWINLNATPFDGAVKEQGTHSAGEKDSGTAQTCIHSDGNITEGIKTIEMYARQPAGGGLVDRRAYWASVGVLCGIRLDRDANTVRYYINGWSGVWAINDDTWYHFALVCDGGDGNSYFYVDNTQRITTANTIIPANVVHHIGNDNNHGNCMHGWIDYVRLSDAIQPGPFPTTD